MAGLTQRCLSRGCVSDALLHSDVGRSLPLVSKRIILGSGGVIFEMHDVFEDFATERTINRFSNAHMLEVNVLDVFPSFPCTAETENPYLERQT